MKFSLLAVFLLFGLLLAKNPFSTRNLIANFEPFPDSFYYVTTPRCWLANFGWKMCRKSVDGIDSATAPLYSAVLLPGFIANDDARTFYFTNVVLALLSLGIFYQVISKLFKQKYIQLSCLVLYATSYHLYWLPTLAMAENLLQTLFLLSLWLLLLKDSKKVLLAQALVAISFTATKYSAAPLTAIYLVIVLSKLCRTMRVAKIVLLLPILITLALVWFFGTVTTVVSVAKNIFQGEENSYFSIYYFVKNLHFYWLAISGEKTTFLWNHQHLYPVWLAVSAALGYSIALIKKQQTLFITAIFLLITGQTVFMSLFYTADARYILPIVTTCLIGFGFFLQHTHELYKKINLVRFYYTILVCISLIVFSTFFIRIKSQVSLNLRYAETPWWYLSVINLNKYFADNTENKPIVVTAISPYLVDYYSNNNYQLLPLASQQDFRGHKEAVWGPNDYSDLLTLYRQKLLDGNEVYVSKYGLGHEADKIAAFQAIQDTFSLELVQSGCYDLCNLYRLHL